MSADITINAGMTMTILTLRTDKPEAELGLFNGTEALEHHSWLAHRELSVTLLVEIEALLNRHDMTLDSLSGIVGYKGPGSFTGLRIGLTVADTLAYAKAVPIVGTAGDDWETAGIARLLAGEDDRIAMPEYGAPVNITKPKK